MRLLELTVERDRTGHLLDPEETLPIKSVSLRLIEAEIYFDRDGQAKLMEHRRLFRTQLLSKATSSTGYWKATNEEIDMLHQAGYELPDWRNISVADIALFYPTWAGD